ncbi:MAG: hypothetical protein AAFN78_07375, partial [Pseudomonadota bacterium]
PVAVVNRRWKGKTTLDLTFVREVRTLEHPSGTIALAHGPLLYALPIAHTEIEGTSYGQPSFNDVYAKPAEPVNKDWQLSKETLFELIAFEDSAPFESRALKCKLYDQRQDREVAVSLVPMGGTVLRQVSFEPAASN